MTKYIANIVTTSRIIASLLLLLTVPFSNSFYIVYVYSGISDMIDGTIARKCKSESKFGAGLDSISDLIFVGICAIKILPCIMLKKWMWVWIAIIGIIKLTNIISGLVVKKKVIFLHTIANKVTGGLVFLLILTVNLIPLMYSVYVVCTIATFAAIQEGCLIRYGRDNDD